MKKSIKKACSLALLLTTATTCVGAGTFTTKTSEHKNSNAVYAEQAASTLTYLQVSGGKKTALVGDFYTVPAAVLNVAGGSPITLTSENYTVKNSVGQTVKVEDGKFKVEGIGKYVIEYSYEYSSQVYTAEVEVVGEIGSTTVVVKDNVQRILPKYVYKSYTGDIYIPEAELKFADDEVEVEYDVSTKVLSPTQTQLAFNEETGKLVYSSLEEGKYSVEYRFVTKKGDFLNRKVVYFEVLSDSEFEKEYKKDYTLKFEYSKTTPTSADIGKELELPSVVGKMGSVETPVYYTVDAYLYANGKEVDVTSQTIADNKFKALKSYTVDGTTYNADNATYHFYYNVKDALGKVAERTGFEISGVKDTVAPVITVADPYDVQTVTEVKDASYKLQSNFENGKNVIIKAIYAEDYADKLSELKLTRYIRKDTQSSTEEDVYSDKNSSVENVFAKDIVFNKVAGYELGANEVDGGELEDGTYTVYYKAEDSSSNVVIDSYTFTVSSSFVYTDEDKPKVEFVDSFKSNVNMGDKVVFSKPTASSENDSRLNTVVMYKFNNDASWTVLEAKEGKYSISVDKEGATSLKVRAVSENGSSEEEVDFTTVDDLSTYESSIKYGFVEKEMTILDNVDTQAPTIVSLGDWSASYTQNEEIEIPALTLTDDLIDYLTVDVVVEHEDGVTMETYDAVQLKTFNADLKSGTFTMSGAKFNATLAGKYLVKYVVVDQGGNKAYIYQNVEVTSVPVVSEPRFANLPEALNEGKLEFGESIELPVPELPSDEYDYMVNVKGPTGATINKNIFAPSKVGTYTVIYQLFAKADPSTILEDATKEFKVVVSDTKGPEIRVDWDLNDSYAKDTSVVIPVFSASDISGINLKDSKIVISSKSYNRTLAGDKLAEYLEEYETSGTGMLKVDLRYNEVYTVTYTVFDNSKDKNSSTLSYIISVGDLIAPTLIVEEDIVKASYEVGDEFTIDVSKITVSDNKTTSMSISDVKIKLTNAAGEEVENILSADNNQYKFKVETAGEYTLTFTAKDEAGNEKVVTRTFTVNEKSNDGLETNEVVAIVACCVAVVILAGAVVYMVVTKKKMKSYK